MKRIMIWVLVIVGFFIQDILLSQFPCENATYGQNCEKTCSRGCAPFNNLTLCDRVSGTCLDGCSAGWHGVQCRNSCGSHCLNRICNQHDGECTLGCVNGMYGHFCETECVATSCGSNCTECSSWKNEVTTINKSHAAATMEDEGCVGSRWGGRCEFSCAVACIEDMCNIVDGRCVFGCPDNYCGTEHCQPCPTTQDDGTLTDVLGNTDIIQYIPTFAVVTTVSLFLLLSVVVFVFIYILCIRQKNLRRQNVVIETTDCAWGENRDASTSIYWKINENDMDGDETRHMVKSAKLNANGNENMRSPGTKRSPMSVDCETDGRYEVVGASSDNHGSVPMLESSERDQACRMDTYYLTPNVSSND